MLREIKFGGWRMSEWAICNKMGDTNSIMKQKIALPECFKNGDKLVITGDEMLK